MAAGAEVSQVVSPLDGPFKRPTLVSHCPGTENLENAATARNGSGVLQQGSITSKDTIRPPRPLSALRHSFSTTLLAENDKVEISSQMAAAESHSLEIEFKPVIRSGGFAHIGQRISMEDEHVRIDDLSGHLGILFEGGVDSGAFYGVFDGHNGSDAARFVKENILQFIVDDVAFPIEVEEAMRRGYRQADVAFLKASSTHDVSSGTTAITVFIIGRDLFVANAGDCRAVLCRRGKVVKMSRDHKPCCAQELKRIETLGGFVSDGYLNGQLSVARALGDWHMKESNGAEGPLTGEPELEHCILSEADEFMIIGCDGLWDVFTNENAVGFVRRRLQLHNDPELCSQELAEEALMRDTRDNLTVVIVCFQAEPPPKLAPAFRVRRTISLDSEGLRTLQDILQAPGC